jgi:hypothetical protein
MKNDIEYKNIKHALNDIFLLILGNLFVSYTQSNSSKLPPENRHILAHPV